MKWTKIVGIFIDKCINVKESLRMYKNCNRSSISHTHTDTHMLAQLQRKMLTHHFICTRKKSPYFFIFLLGSRIWLAFRRKKEPNKMGVWIIIHQIIKYFPKSEFASNIRKWRYLPRYIEHKKRIMSCIYSTFSPFLSSIARSRPNETTVIPYKFRMELGAICLLQIFPMNHSILSFWFCYHFRMCFIFYSPLVFAAIFLAEFFIFFSFVV